MKIITLKTFTGSSARPIMAYRVSSAMLAKPIVTPCLVDRK